MSLSACNTGRRRCASWVPPANEPGEIYRKHSGSLHKTVTWTRSIYEQGARPGNISRTSVCVS